MSTPDERLTLAPFHFDRSWTFPVSPRRFWELISQPEDFPRWWPWLRSLENAQLAEGARVRCAVRSPLPYSIGVTVHVVRLVAGALVEADVDGDLRGPARLEVRPAAGTSLDSAGPAGTSLDSVGLAGTSLDSLDSDEASASQVRVVWEVQLTRPVLRAAARVARPAMEWGHDWVVAQGVDQFRRRALGVETGHDREHES